MRLNEQINAAEVRLITEDGEMVGIVPIEEAREQATREELDLVEIAPQATPPVCKLMDFGKYKYQQQKKIHDQRKKSHGRELKEMRIKSFRIDPHDLGIKLKKTREFLMEGHRVQFTLLFRSREHDHADLGRALMIEQVAEPLSNISKIDSPPRKDGRRMTMVVAPLPNLEKILAKRKTDAEKEANLAQARAEADARAESGEAPETDEPPAGADADTTENGGPVRRQDEE